MTPEEYAAERSRFARLLGTTPETGSGLPIGTSMARDADDRSIDERAARRRERNGAEADRETNRDHRSNAPPHHPTADADRSR